MSLLTLAFELIVLGFADLEREKVARPMPVRLTSVR